jgi:hypothetical protein
MPGGARFFGRGANTRGVPESIARTTCKLFDIIQKASSAYLHNATQS